MVMVIHFEYDYGVRYLCFEMSHSRKAMSAMPSLPLSFPPITRPTIPSRFFALSFFLSTKVLLFAMTGSTPPVPRAVRGMPCDHKKKEKKNEGEMKVHDIKIVKHAADYHNISHNA